MCSHKIIGHSWKPHIVENSARWCQAKTTRAVETTAEILQNEDVPIADARQGGQDSGSLLGLTQTALGAGRHGSTLNVVAARVIGR